MAYDDLIGILGNRRNEIYGSNPWYTTGTQLSKQNYYTPESSNWENIGAALLGGLASGAMRTYGKNQAEQEFGSEANALSDILMGGQVTPEELDANPTLAPYKSVILVNQKDAADRQKAAEDSLGRQMFLAEYQQQMKNRYGKPAGSGSGSKLEKEYEFLSQQLGPEAAQSYLRDKAKLPVATPVNAQAQSDGAAGVNEEDPIVSTLRNTKFSSVGKEAAAIKEYGLTKGVTATLKEIDEKWKELEEIPSLRAMNPFSKESVKFKTRLLDILPTMKPFFGALSENDRKELEAKVPKVTDSKEVIAQKGQEIKDFLISRALSTPTLDVALPPGVAKKFKEDNLMKFKEADAPKPEIVGGFRIVRDASGKPIGKVRIE